jgi:N-acetylglucosamine-6-phosphate deacetylase
MELEVGSDEVVRLPGSPYFAGSALRLDRGVANAVEWLGLAPELVHAMASEVPARVLGFSPPTLTPRF